MATSPAAHNRASDGPDTAEMGPSGQLTDSLVTMKTREEPDERQKPEGKQKPHSIGELSSSNNSTSCSSGNNVLFNDSTQFPTRRAFTSCASEPQLWRSVVRPTDQPLRQQQDQEQKPQHRRRSSGVYPSKCEADSDVILREACVQDLPLIRTLMKRHLRSLILPAVFYWLCRHAQDFGSFVVICCCFAPFTRMLLSLFCFLLLLLVRVVLELEQYAAKGCPDLENFERQYLQADRNRFWVAEKTQQHGKIIIGCIGFIIHQASPQDGQLVRLVVSPGHRGAGVGSRLLSAALGFAASCRCRSIEVCANSLNASSARFLRNRQFELVQVVKRKLMRGDLLRWRMLLDGEGRPMEPKPELAFGSSSLQSE